MSQFGLMILPFEPQYLVSDIFPVSNFLFDKKMFLDAFQKKWRFATFKIWSDPKYEWINEGGEYKLVETEHTIETLGWSLPPETDGAYLSGYVKEYAISLEEFPRKSLVEFIIWYRGIVPDTNQLYLTKPDNLDKVLYLTNKTTEAEILKFVGSPIEE